MPSITSPQAGAVPRQRRRSSNVAKQAIYLMRPAADFRPQRAWDWPPTIEGELFARNLSTHDAATFARVHNDAQIRRQQATGEPIEAWAVVAKFLNPWRKATTGPTWPAVRLFRVAGDRVAVALRGPGTPAALRAALAKAIAELDALTTSGVSGAEVGQ